MYEDSIKINDVKFSKFKSFFTTNTTSWIIFGLIILAGILTRIFLWDFSSSDMIVWKEAAEYLIQGKNPYEHTLESFQNEGMKHFYAYFPLWLYICSMILLIFPEAWFFGTIKGLTLLFDIQVVILLFFILQPKVNDTWRLKIPIAVWFITPIVLMTSSMHGKFDSLMFVFIFIACIAHEKGNLIFESIFLSLAILTKPIALIIIPFFYQKEFRERNFKKIFSKIGLLFLPLILFSIPFLGQPLIYLQGSLGVHVTRDFDMAPLFMLLSLPFTSLEADRIIRIILTVIIIISWIGIILLSYFKEYDIYKSILYTFVMFNTLYWVFLVQYTVWIYTFYIPVTSKSIMRHWHLGILTSGIIILSTVLLALLGAFIKVGL
ncbi:MAG: hypothetical protein JXA54_03585 [Candidatus Heimdallarchaeota archaeon]|nr:hypothetical protein [Candidatus Heimdallarchaeota archaeon]